VRLLRLIAAISWKHDLIPVNFPPMADYADDNLSRLCVREVEHAIIAYTDTPTISISKLLAAMWKRIVFEGQDGLRNAGLNR